MTRIIFHFLFILLTINISYAAQSLPAIELTIRPAKVSDTDKQYRLLPTEDGLTDADAVPLYEKAVRSLPSDLDMKQINQWRNAPMDELPLEQVKSVLDKCKPTMELIEQAAKCRQCKWPQADLESKMKELSKYRQILFIRYARIRLLIAQKQYEQVISNVQTNLAMARHLAEAPTLIQGLVGIAIAGLTLNQIDELVQNQDGPNLFWALELLPVPLVNLEKAMANEPGVARDAVQSQVNHVNRKVAALQCIEAMRLYAGMHDGKFPDKLSDITELNVPNDPVTGKLFSYDRAGPQAVLEAEATEGSQGRDAIRYELKLVEK